MNDERAVEAEAQVREHGAVAVKTLTGGVTVDEAAALLDALRSRGLDVTKKVARVPLTEQLTRLMRDTGALPLAGIDKRLAGASAAEAKRAVTELTTTGTLALQKRGRTENVLWAEGRVADDDVVTRARASITSLKTLATRLDKRTKAAALKKHPLLHEEVDAMRAELTALLDSLPSAPSQALQPEPAPAAAPVADRVREALATFDRDPLLQLVYLPDFVRALGRTGIGVAPVHEALLEAASAGLIDLRPESDPDRLSTTDRKLCMEAPSGRLLSYVRCRD